MNDKLQRTLVLLKPDAINRGIVGEILQRFERVGAKMVGLKLLISDADTAAQHYTEDISRRRGEHIRKLMIEMLTSGPIMAIVFEGVEIVEVVRKLVGETEPKKAAPGTIRAEWGSKEDGKNKMCNIAHASDSAEAAVVEVKRFFKEKELYQ